MQTCSSTQCEKVIAMVVVMVRLFQSINGKAQCRHHRPSSSAHSHSSLCQATTIATTSPTTPLTSKKKSGGWCCCSNAYTLIHNTHTRTYAYIHSRMLTLAHTHTRAYLVGISKGVVAMAQSTTTGIPRRLVVGIVLQTNSIKLCVTTRTWA